MKLNYERIGNYIDIVDKRNIENKFTVEDLIGIRIDKTFIPSVANVSGTDLSKYKILESNVFAYSPMQVGRDKKVRVVLYQNSKPSIISPAYLTFAIKDTNILLPEYLMLNFLRSELDRYGWFISDGSVRASLDWERFCEIEIFIPPIDEQRKIVKLYNSLNQNLNYVKANLEDLKKVNEAYIEWIKKTKDFVEIGEYINQCDLRNRDLENPLTVQAVKGISNNKVFIETKANMSNVDINGYKVVESLSFAFVTVTSRNGNKISIALNNGSNKLVSSTYVVFKVSDSQKLLPEFLYLWFNRAEFDRYSRYHSLGSARETFNWEDMCSVKIPLPPIEEQHAIVKVHHVLRKRIELVEKLETQIKDLAPILIRGAVAETVQV